jgi:hypothetical protein
MRGGVCTSSSGLIPLCNSSAPPPTHIRWITPAIRPPESTHPSFNAPMRRGGHHHHQQSIDQRERGTRHHHHHHHHHQHQAPAPVCNIPMHPVLPAPLTQTCPPAASACMVAHEKEWRWWLGIGQYLSRSCAGSSSKKVPQLVTISFKCKLHLLLTWPSSDAACRKEEGVFLEEDPNTHTRSVSVPGCEAIFSKELTQWY